jgi:hypothetical protein
MTGKENVQLRESIIRTLLYSDIFNYPLTAVEVYTKLGTNHTNTVEVQNELENLRQEGVVFKSENFFSIQDQPDLAEKRLNGNLKAAQIMPFAIRRAQLIYQFPFVRAVMISGSLSKNFMDDKSDLDYFVVTKPGRLWIARSSMALFKRVFLKNSHRFFCVNYFIDSDHLHIEEQNIFTASELSTLIPVCGHGLYHQLIGANHWLTSFFPNFNEKTNQSDHARTSFIKRMLEGVLQIAASSIDNFLMRIAANRWKRQFGKKFSKQDFDIAFKTSKHVSKNHPRHFQKSVTALYEQKVNSYFERVPQS